MPAQQASKFWQPQLELRVQRVLRRRARWSLAHLLWVRWLAAWALRLAPVRE
jgi:hypothetical protein